MKTIKFKLFYIFTALMSLLILGVILLNTFFLHSFYTYRTKGILENVGHTILELYKENSENAYEYIDSISDSDGISSIIIDGNMNIEYNSLKSRFGKNKKLVNDDLRPVIFDDKNKKPVKDKHPIYQSKVIEDQMTKIVNVTKLEDEKYLILIKYINGIQNNVDIANQFFIIAGIIVLLLGSIVILIFSRKITKPIVEMSNVAESISNLKFDKVVDVKTEDEIGVLGDSINKISTRLSKNIIDLQNDVERRKMLVRNMSHELKTPIAIIKGYAEGLKYGIVNNEEKRNKYCDVLVSECDKIDKLIRELLDYSMMEGGMVKLNPSSFKADEFLKTIVKRFQPLFEEKNIEVNLECVEDLVLYADRELLEKAVNNYVVNAINNCDEKNNKREVDIKGISKENNFILSVFNTGGNIQQEEINRIWDVCYKIDKARTRKDGRHGIGLSIVKLISDMHDGTSMVKNLENGVEFIIKIPINMKN